MEEYTRFLEAYEKNFLRNRDFCIKFLISTAEEILTDTKEFQEVISLAYGFLKILSDKPFLNIGKMKMLASYQQLLRRNQEGEKRTSAIEFSTVLYMLHYYTLRILRSPWRKDYLVMKTYNGYFLHTTRRVSSSTVCELFSFLGFRRNIKNDTLEFEHIRLDRNVLRGLKEVGVDFFLSYAHCMISHDSVFRNRVKEWSKELTDYSAKTETKVSALVENSNAEISGARNHPSYSGRGGRESFQSESRQVSNILKPIRKDINNKLDFNALRDAEMYEAPLDLSVSLNHKRQQPVNVARHRPTAYRHKYHEIDNNRYARPLSGSSDDLDDRALYESDTETSAEPKLFKETHTDRLELSLENNVLYPPTDVKISKTSGNMAPALPPRFTSQTDYVSRSPKKHAAATPLDVQMAQHTDQVLQISDRHYAPLSNGVLHHTEMDILVPPQPGSYVKFTPSIAQERGRPDGEYAKSTHHMDNSKRLYIPPNTKDSQRTRDNITHIYHDVKPDSFYSNGALS